MKKYLSLVITSLLFLTFDCAAMRITEEEQIQQVQHVLTRYNRLHEPIRFKKTQTSIQRAEILMTLLDIEDEREENLPFPTMLQHILIKLSKEEAILNVENPYSSSEEEEERQEHHNKRRRRKKTLRTWDLEYFSSDSPSEEEENSCDEEDRLDLHLTQENFTRTMEDLSEEQIQRLKRAIAPIMNASPEREVFNYMCKNFNKRTLENKDDMLGSCLLLGRTVYPECLKYANGTHNIENYPRPFAKKIKRKRKNCNIKHIREGFIEQARGQPPAEWHLTPEHTSRQGISGEFNGHRLTVNRKGITFRRKKSTEAIESMLAIARLLYLKGYLISNSSEERDF